MTVYAASESVDGACGINNIHGYSWNGQNGYWWNHVDSLRDVEFGGANFALAGFVNNRLCRAAYNELCEHHTLLYQSPVRYNENSGRQFFICIFSKGK